MCIMTVNYQKNKNKIEINVKNIGEKARNDKTTTKEIEKLIDEIYILKYYTIKEQKVTFLEIKQ